MEPINIELLKLVQHLSLLDTEIKDYIIAYRQNTLYNDNFNAYCDDN